MSTDVAATAAAAPAEALVTHTGACHCGAVTFEVDAPADLTVWDCNCSICLLKRNTHFIVPKSRFRLLTGADKITEYRFNTKVAVHCFCSVCGVQAFYSPRSNPDGCAVTVHCIAPGTIKSVSTVKFDGANWEAFFKTSDISKFSKEPTAAEGAAGAAAAAATTSA